MAEATICSECGGDGLMEVTERWGPFNGTEGIFADCDACDGEGVIELSPVSVSPTEEPK